VAESTRASSGAQIADTFRWETQRSHRQLFLILLAMGLWGVAQQASAFISSSTSTTIWIYPSCKPHCKSAVAAWKG
jgi:hypothetical protein